MERSEDRKTNLLNVFSIARTKCDLASFCKPNHRSSAKLNIGDSIAHENANIYRGYG